MGEGLQTPLTLGEGGGGGTKGGANGWKGKTKTKRDGNTIVKLKSKTTDKSVVGVAPSSDYGL